MRALRIRLAAYCAAVLALTMISSMAAADDSWLMRIRVINMNPDVSSTVNVIGGGVDINSDTVPELDITYFFTDHIAAELILATIRYSVDVVGSILGNVDLGRVSLLPPTLTAQWHFFLTRRSGPISPPG